MTSVTLGERLKFLRQSRKKTLDELAVDLDTTKTTLSRYENNKRVPDADFIIRLANYFKVSADYILCLSDNPFTVTDFVRSQKKHR
jgi:transcriptional regulator with XRE-family HTH domain